MISVSSKITVKINDEEFELDINQAKELYAALGEAIGKPNEYVPIYPYVPYPYVTPPLEPTYPQYPQYPTDPFAPYCPTITTDGIADPIGQAGGWA